LATPNGAVISRQTPFDEQFLDVPIRKREPQIPADGANNDFGFEVPPFKQGWPRFGHRLAAYQTRAPDSCNTSVDKASPILFQHCLGGRRLAVSVVFPNAVSGGPHHTLNLSDAVITDIKPHYPQPPEGELTRYEELTIVFPEHHFNEIRNAPIPHTLFQALPWTRPPSDIQTDSTYPKSSSH
jgi:hypothetical protein